MTAYETDGYAWAMEQADALRRRSTNEVDWDNVAEEVEDVGKAISRELRSRLEILLLHLLKWRYQPSRRGQSWSLTIAEQRLKIGQHIEENPSLKAIRDQEFDRAYQSARLRAARETKLDKSTFPSEAPFDPADALTDDWLPDANAE